MSADVANRVAFRVQRLRSMQRRREGNALKACAESPRLAADGALAAAEEGPARDKAAQTTRRLRRANRESEVGWGDAMDAPDGPRLRSAVPSLALLRDLQCALAAARRAELQCVVEDAVAEQRRDTVQSIRAARRARLARGAWGRYGGGAVRAGLATRRTTLRAAAAHGSGKGGGRLPSPAERGQPECWTNALAGDASVLSGASDTGPHGAGAWPRTPAGTLKPAGAPQGAVGAPAWSRSSGQRAVPLLRPRSATSCRGPASPTVPRPHGLGHPQRPTTASALARRPTAPSSASTPADHLSPGSASSTEPAQSAGWAAPSPPPSTRPSLSSPRNRSACRWRTAASGTGQREQGVLPSPVETRPGAFPAQAEQGRAGEQGQGASDAAAAARAEQRLRRALSGIPAEILGSLQEQPSKRLQAIHATSSATGSSGAAWQSMLRREPERALAGSLIKSGSFARPRSAHRASRAAADPWAEEAAMADTRQSRGAAGAGADASGAAAIAHEREAALAGLEAAVAAAQAAYTQRVQAQVKASGARYQLSQADCKQSEQQATVALVEAEARAAEAAADAADTLAEALSQAGAVLEPRGLPPAAQTLPISVDMHGMVLTSPSLMERVRCDSLRRAGAARAAAASLRGAAGPQAARDPAARGVASRPRQRARGRSSAQAAVAEPAWMEGKADDAGELLDLDVTSGTAEAASRSLGRYLPPPSSERPGREEAPPAAAGAGWKSKAARRRGSAFSSAAYCAGQAGVLATRRLPVLAARAEADEASDSDSSSSSS